MVTVRIGALAIIAASTATAVLAQPGTPAAPAVPVPISRIIDYEPAWSPDGKFIAFVSNRSGPLKVWTMHADGSDPRQLTVGDHEDDAPAWSPDGSRIAYVSMQDGQAEIYLTRADGTQTQRLTRDSGSDIHPQWSPDGSRILFNSSRHSLDSSNPDVFELFTMNVDGSDVRPITRGGVATYASYSPDGSRLVFRRQASDGNSEIVVAAADGSGEKNISRNPAFDGWPAWSRDGRRIVFARESGDDAHILAGDPDGSCESVVVERPGRSTNPRWSPTADRIVFSRRADREIRLYLLDLPSAAPARCRPDRLDRRGTVSSRRTREPHPSSDHLARGRGIVRQDGAE